MSVEWAFPALTALTALAALAALAASIIHRGQVCSAAKEEDHSFQPSRNPGCMDDGWRGNPLTVRKAPFTTETVPTKTARYDGLAKKLCGVTLAQRSHPDNRVWGLSHTNALKPLLHGRFHRGLRNLGRPWGRLTARWLIHRIKVQQSASYQNRCRSCCRKRSLKDLSGLSFATRNNLHQAKRRAILRATVHVHWVPHVTGEQGFGTAQTRKLFSKAPPPQLVRRPPTISRVKAQPGVRE